MSDRPAPARGAAPGLSRRALLSAVGAAACAGPVRASGPALSLLGYLGSETADHYDSRLRAFRDGLAEAGLTEGRNVTLTFEWAEGRYDRLPALARELAARHPAVIVAPGGAQVALAAKAATTTIPIVFEMGGDPVALGIVDSLSRPGGNLTGVSSLSVEVSRKRLEFMREVRPAAKLIAVAVNPASPTLDRQVTDLRAAAEGLHVELLVLAVRSETELEGLFVAVRESGAGGLVFSSDPFFAHRSRQIADLATRFGVPAITQSRDFALSGGLMSYGGDFHQSHRQTGVYAGHVLKGRAPADLPVQRVTKVEMLVNLKAANSLGVTIPHPLISSADEVIE